MKWELAEKYQNWMGYSLMIASGFGFIFLVGILSGSLPILREQVVYLSSLAFAFLALGNSIACFNFVWNLTEKKWNPPVHLIFSNQSDTDFQVMISPLDKVITLPKGEEIHVADEFKTASTILKATTSPDGLPNFFLWTGDIRTVVKLNDKIIPKHKWNDKDIPVKPG